MSQMRNPQGRGQAIRPPLQTPGIILGPAGPVISGKPAGVPQMHPAMPPTLSAGMPGVLSMPPGMAAAHIPPHNGPPPPVQQPPQNHHVPDYGQQQGNVAPRPEAQQNGSVVAITHPPSGQVPQGNAGEQTLMPNQSGDPGQAQSQNPEQKGDSSKPEEKTQMNLANTKEKTPMCLINELSFYNKIKHQYTLTDEQGPAHIKKFFVKLQLGEEEYSASGPSIKKAQHAAAAIALEKTQYSHPPPRPAKRNPGYNPNHLHPCVELNALAMKLGEPAIYHPIEPQRPPYYPPPSMDFRGMYNQRYHYPRWHRLFYVSLKVGQREFIGEGHTRQSARHNAALKALQTLRDVPLPDGAQPKPQEAPENGQEEENADDDLKSEISLVHEIALKRNMSVDFQVMNESGPPHMRVFVTRCIVGEIVTEGEGNRKKLSKKRAAEKMLEELKKLGPLPAASMRPKNPQFLKKRHKNLKVNSTSVMKPDPASGESVHPVSRLIQIQQAKKEKEPVYSLMSEHAERGRPRVREFVMQVQVGEQKCTGVGPNKKVAKRNAAEVMLQLLGYSRPSPQPAKPAIKGETPAGQQQPQQQQQQQSPQIASDKKVTFVDQEAPAMMPPGRQLVPGVLLMPDGTKPLGMGGGYGMPANQAAMNRPNNQYQQQQQQAFPPQTVSAVAKEILDTGVSPTADAIIKSGARPGLVLQQISNMSPKMQLLYMSDVLGFQVQFTDFPKGNKTEFLSLASLSTNPPHVCHGAGITIEASHDMAALTAMRGLAEMDVTKIEKPKEEHLAAGDGPHIKMEPGTTRM